MTTKQAAEKSGIPEKLIRSVIRQTGRGNLSDIANHGCAGGFAGFTYYVDTVAFFKRNRSDIMELAERMAVDIGEDTIEMIRGFNCLSSGQYPNRKPDFTSSEVAEAIYRGKGDCAQQIQNALAWFAAEEVARAFEE